MTRYDILKKRKFKKKRARTGQVSSPFPEAARTIDIIQGLLLRQLQGTATMNDGEPPSPPDAESTTLSPLPLSSLPPHSPDQLEFANQWPGTISYNRNMAVNGMAVNGDVTVSGNTEIAGDLTIRGHVVNPGHQIEIGRLDRPASDRFFARIWRKIKNCVSRPFQRRRLRIVWADSLSTEDIDNLREQVEMALKDPDFVIVSNYEIHVESADF